MENKNKQFNAFDKVLVVNKTTGVWMCDLYSNYDNEFSCHRTFKGYLVRDSDILPYEGNEELVGTTDSPVEEVKLEDGEWGIFFDDIERTLNGTSGSFRKYMKSNKWLLDSNNLSWEYVIRFSDVNPNDMEETKKHILCKKNGKIVRYKG